MLATQATVRVFISYTQETAEHSDRCRELADRLRGDGIDAWIDQYAPAPAEGWPRWMQAQIVAARFVILVCTPSFRRRFEGAETAGRGLGATWEGLIATQVLYDDGARNEKFVPVFFDGETTESVPLLLRPFTRYALSSGYDALYRHLTDQPATPPPSLGPTKVMPPRNPSAGGVATAAPTSAVASMPPGADAVLRAQNRFQALYELLMLLFSASELRIWLRLGAEGDALVRSLPSESSPPTELAFKATDTLQRWGLVDAGLFARLAADRPRHVALIDHVRGLWLAP